VIPVPWHIEKNCKGCPKYKSYGVVKGHAGEHGQVEGCHPTRASANQQLKALYASEDNMNVKSLIAAGFTPESAAIAASTGDASQLQYRSALYGSLHSGTDDDGDNDGVDAPGIYGDMTDQTFLTNLNGQLAGTKAYAEGYMGTHAGVKALADSVAGTHTDHMNSITNFHEPTSGADSEPVPDPIPRADETPLEARAMGTKQDTKPKTPYGNVTYADPGYQKDKKKRYPIDTKEHVKAAWSYISQSDNASSYSAQQLASIKGRIKSAAKKFGISISSNSRLGINECVRSFGFEPTVSGDGRTMEGYAAVFNSVSRIADWGGDFDEVIRPGAFARSLQARKPVLQFDHGRDARVGSVPIGAIDDIHEDSQGLYVRARLFDNDTVEPVRQAIEGGAINGMSFRFGVPKGGDKWTNPEKRSDGVSDAELREIFDTDTRECGPVVFPAYDATTVTVRSLLSQLDREGHRALVRELAEEVRSFVDLEDIAVDLPVRDGSDSEPDVEPRSGDASMNEITARIFKLSQRFMEMRHSAAYERNSGHAAE
jgi:HK97 family phage prohead protease